MTRMRGIAILAGILLALTLVGGAAGQVTNQYQTDNVNHEPSHPDDSAPPANGFASSSPGSWDLVLDQYITNNAGTVGENSVYAALLMEAGQAQDEGQAERFMFPGAASSSLHYGWFNDKGSGGYMREAGQGSSNPDGVIDDGNDDGSNATHFDDAAEECGTDGPTCWTSTGTWDEFVWKGPNQAIKNGDVTHVSSPKFTFVKSDDIQAHGYIQPGTTRSWFITTTGCESCNHPVRTPGSGIISGKRDDPDVPDFKYQPGDSGQSWNGALFVSDDTSLLITTEVTAAINTQTVGGERPVATADEADKDVYSSISGEVEMVYRTAVWDPGNEQGSPTDAVHEEGPKGFLKDFYDNDYPQLGDEIEQAIVDAQEPIKPVQGAADDATGFWAPYKHEPNHPEDSYPGATYNSGAEYNGQLSDGPYYAPTQSWSGYAQQEHFWADTQNRYNVYGVVVQGAFGYKFGHNTESPTTQDDQQTQGPGILSHFSYVGHWYDAQEDTWVGDLDDQGRCSTQKDPYCGGNSDYPDDVSHNPTSAPDDDTFEFFGTCSADLDVTFTPLGTPENSDDEPAWGTTVPPVGVYKYPVFHEEAVVEGADTVNNVEGRYRQYGSVTFDMPSDEACDETSQGADGQWFPYEGLLLPTGTADYPIKMEVTATFTGDRPVTRGTSISNPNLEGETVTDVDIINHWQDETNDA